MVTGGNGFIGTNLVRLLINSKEYLVVNLDALTYAANTLSLADLDGNQDHVFVKGNIIDSELVASLFEQYQPVGIFHLAAESLDEVVRQKCDISMPSPQRRQRRQTPSYEATCSLNHLPESMPKPDLAEEKNKRRCPSAGRYSGPRGWPPSSSPRTGSPTKMRSH